MSPPKAARSASVPTTLRQCQAAAANQATRAMLRAAAPRPQASPTSGGGRRQRDGRAIGPEGSPTGATARTTCFHREQRRQQGVGVRRSARLVSGAISLSDGMGASMSTTAVSENPSAVSCTSGSANRPDRPSQDCQQHPRDQQGCDQRAHVKPHLIVGTRGPDVGWC